MKYELQGGALAEQREGQGLPSPPHGARGSFNQRTRGRAPTAPEGHSEGRTGVDYLCGHGSPQGHPGGGAEEPDVHPRSGKRGLVTGHSDITAGDQLTAGGRGQAVHHGDDGDRVVPDEHHDLQE